MDWFLRIAKTGVEPKPLKTLPQLCDHDMFYLNMYRICGVEFSNVREFCSLHRFSSEEILESFEIMSLIYNGVG